MAPTHGLIQAVFLLESTLLNWKLDVQGNAFLVEYEPVEMKQWGVVIIQWEDRTVEYVAPRNNSGATSISPQRRLYQINDCRA